MMNSEYVSAGGFVGGSATQMWLAVGIKVGFGGGSATRLRLAVATNGWGRGGMVLAHQERFPSRTKP